MPGLRNARLSLSSILIMLLSAVLFSAMALVAKQASTRLSGPEVALVRFIVGLMTCAAASLFVESHANNWSGLFWRGAFGGVAVLGYFLSLEHLPVGLATLLN